MPNPFMWLLNLVGGLIFLLIGIVTVTLKVCWWILSFLFRLVISTIEIVVIVLGAFIGKFFVPRRNREM